MKQKISGWFIAVALLVVLSHTALPHHHHGNIVCFNPKCIETCCCHHEHQHDHEQTAPSCQCHHHHHSSDECVLSAPFLLGSDARDICQKIVSDKDLFCFDFAEVVSEIILIQLECSENHIFKNDSPPVPTVYALSSRAFRAPPAI